MPKNFFDGGMHGHRFGDLHWIIEQIDKLPIGIQKDVAEKYSDIYESLKGSDLQRFRANTWLRMVIIKYRIETDENETIF